MTLRLVAALVLVASAACGAATSSGTEPGGSDALTLAVRPSETLRAGGPVEWRLVVANPTGEDVVLSFPSGQQGDVVLRSADGTEAYRWSDGMMFTQALADVALPAGGEVTFTLAGTLAVEPGGYVLEATVPSDPAPEPLRADVTVAG